MWLLTVRGKSALRDKAASVALQVLTGVSVDADVLPVEEGAFCCRRVRYEAEFLSGNVEPVGNRYKM